MIRLRINLPKRFLLLCTLTLLAVQAHAQCGCPDPGSCNPCSGGITSFTLKYVGILPTTVNVWDDGDRIYSKSVTPGETFTFTGQESNSRFHDDDIAIYTGILPNTELDVNCSLRFDPSQRHGSFTIVAATSRNGGPLCCTSNNANDDPPVFNNCPSNVTVSAAANCKATATWNAPTATGCSLDPLTVSHQPGSEFPIGTTKVTYTARDVNDRTATCTFNVIVNDATGPVASAQPPPVNVNANGSCKATASWTAPTFTDNCNMGAVTSTHNPGATFSLGTTEVIYTAQDAAGNKTTVKFNVIVKDATAPVSTNCPGNLQLTAGANCKATATWTAPTFTDNCGAVTVTASHNPGAEFPVGTTQVTYTAKDAANNTTTCKFNVVVGDKQLPVITGCPSNLERTAASADGIAVTWTAPTATDACGMGSLTASHNPGAVFPVGNTTVTYTATDKAGNIAKCTFQVSVAPPPKDPEDPDGPPTGPEEPEKPEDELDVIQLITPDGNGANDVWIIGNIDKYTTNNVVVTDRWGSVVYSTTAYNNETNAWDGTGNNGKQVPTGTYFYTISVQSTAGSREKKGFIEVVR